MVGFRRSSGSVAEATAPSGAVEGMGSREWGQAPFLRSSFPISPSRTRITARFVEMPKAASGSATSSPISSGSSRRTRLPLIEAPVGNGVRNLFYFRTRAHRGNGVRHLFYFQSPIRIKTTPPAGDFRV